MVFVFSTSQFLASSFLILCLLIVHLFLSLCVYVEAFSLDVDFCLIFHYNTSNLEASCPGSSQVFDNYTSKQATQTQSSWSAHSHGFKSVMWLWIWLWEECWPCEQSTKRVRSAVSSCTVFGCCSIWLLVRASKHHLRTKSDTKFNLEVIHRIMHYSKGHINNDVQAITTDMIQGWIRETLGSD